eukprot:Amastigsp_a344748_3.p4 type:complete len:114 gc:universal Amastigsp_a344748_3:390-49(-)
MGRFTFCSLLCSRSCSCLWRACCFLARERKGGAGSRPSGAPTMRSTPTTTAFLTRTKRMSWCALGQRRSSARTRTTTTRSATRAGAAVRVRRRGARAAGCASFRGAAVSCDTL